MFSKRTAQLSLSLLFASFSLVHCASSGQTLNATPPSTKLGNYKRIVVNVTSSVEEASTETVQIENMIISSLRNMNAFQSVTSASSGSTDGDLRLNANISDMRKVSGGKRAVLGAFAGRGNLVVDVKLVDARTSNQVGAFTAQGTTSGGTVFAGTTEQAIELAVKQIADYVHSNM